MSRRILIVFAHPVLERSRVNRRLVAAVRELPGVTVDDLYEEYPTLAIDVRREQALLAAHDVVVLQHPFYWYSAPAIVKEWLDLVLTHGWAYGEGGTTLRGKVMFNAITTGGGDDAYHRAGYNRFTMRELLAPFDQTAYLCGMRYLAPFVVHGALRLVGDRDVAPRAEAYRRLLEALRDDRLDLDAAQAAATLDDLDRLIRPERGRVTGSVLFLAFVLLAAAVVCAPLGKRLGLGAVLGYLVAGVVVGPHVLALVGHEGKHLMHFAEFGVVMMLFLVGLELQPTLLWQLRRPILGLGGAQVVVTSALAAAAAFALGVDARPALAVGMILAMSSTAIVLASLSERGLLRTSGGQSAFSVLLFQDIAVIPILAVFPLLGSRAVAAGGAERPAWQTALLIVGAVAGVVAAGRFVVRPTFRFLATVKLRESFTAAALLLVIAIALLMDWVGLSPALGTFVAGVVLAESEYRHELESDIEPFKGLLLGLFFITVGAQIDFPLIGREPLTIAGIVVGTMMLKLGVLYVLGRSFRLDRPARWLLALALAQIGEFAFVLLSFGRTSGIYGAELEGPLVAAVAISMVLTPLVFVALERRVLPAVTDDTADRPHDEISHADTPVVIAGFGRFGQVVGRMLRASGVASTVLDLDPAMVDLLGRLGLKVYYGDASRLDLLHAAGCARAKIFVLAIDDTEQAVEIVKTLRTHFPHLKVLARARNRIHYYALRRLGVHFVHRETYASAWELGIEVFRALGHRAHTAHRMAQRWRIHEEKSVEELSEMWAREADNAEIFAQARRALEESERLMRDEQTGTFGGSDGAWDNEALRADRRPDDT